MRSDFQFVGVPDTSLHDCPDSYRIVKTISDHRSALRGSVMINIPSA
ncbi:MAG: hypothetical protein JW840_10690 [Candidatus Thermoplasmatota archaeon]|nr:hypothetical protein [Candidatus Thermoplasmatota archaeon]